MGPYMAPMAANVPLTVSFSTLCALTVVPWLSYLLLRRSAPTSGQAGAVRYEPGCDARLGQTGISPTWWGPFSIRASNDSCLYLVVFVLLVLSMALALFRYVPMKMLPFDNKNEFQIVIDMPEGTTLEQTSRVVQDFEQLPSPGSRGNEFYFLHRNGIPHGFQRHGAALLSPAGGAM